MVVPNSKSWLLGCVNLRPAGFTQPGNHLLEHLCMFAVYLVATGAVTAVEAHDAVVEVAEGVQAELRAVRPARRDCAEAGRKGRR